MVLYGYSCTAVLYGTVLVLYGYCMVPVLLYGCMVLYGCTAVWYCMGNILVDLAGSYLDLVGIPMPSAECMGLYRGGLLSNRSELDAMGGMPLGVYVSDTPWLVCNFLHISIIDDRTQTRSSA